MEGGTGLTPVHPHPHPCAQQQRAAPDAASPDAHNSLVSLWDLLLVSGEPLFLGTWRLASRLVRLLKTTLHLFIRPVSATPKSLFLVFFGPIGSRSNLSILLLFIYWEVYLGNILAHLCFVFIIVVLLKSVTAASPYWSQFTSCFLTF